MHGRLLYKAAHDLGTYSGSIFPEDLSYLAQGIYLLRISGGGMVYSGKIVRE